MVGRAFDAGRSLPFQDDRVADMGAGVDDTLPVAQMGERQIADPHLLDGDEPAIGEHETARREAGGPAGHRVHGRQIVEVDSGDVAQIRAVVAVRMIPFDGAGAGFDVARVGDAHAAAQRHADAEIQSPVSGEEAADETVVV